VTDRDRQARAHVLRDVLNAAAGGTFPDPDGRVVVVGEAPGLCDAVVAFTAHHVVATCVPAEEIRANLPNDDFAAPMTARFLVWLSERLSSEPGFVDVVLAAPSTSIADLVVHELPIGDVMNHPRVRRAAAYRTKLRAYRTTDGSGLIVLGRGLADRWEVAVEVDANARRRGVGRSLAIAARALVPSNEALFAQVTPGNTASIRTFLAAGYAPIGAEVLFPRRGEGSL